MYSLTVRDHFMIAHSFTGAAFGPAQRLHGATYVVELTFRRERLDPDGVVVDIGLAAALLRDVLAPLNYANLDEIPEFLGFNTTTEFLAREIFNRIRKAIRAGALGPDTAGAFHSLAVVLRESPDAWAGFEDRLD